MGAFSKTFRPKFQHGTLLNPYDAFNIPSTGYTIPVDSTTNWVKERTTGTPTATLSVVDVTDASVSKKIKGNKALQFVTGGTATYSNYIKYTFQAGNKPADFTAHSFLIWIKYEQGSDISLWTGNVGLYVILWKDTSNYIRGLLSVVNVEHASSGWYAYSFTPSYGGTVTGTVALTDITSMGIQISKTDLATSPIIQVGMIKIVPNTGKAQLCLMFDNVYESQEAAATLLSANNMLASFYVDGGAHISVARIKAMQDNGHLIGAYARNWGANVGDTAAAIATLTTAQAWIATNGLGSGRHFVHGLTSAMTEVLWNTSIYKYADTVGYTGKFLTSPYHKNFVGRYNQFSNVNKAACITMLNAAITDKARAGILIHDLLGVDWTAFSDFITNTVAPAVVAGTLEVITVKQAFDKSKTF